MTVVVAVVVYVGLVSRQGTEVSASTAALGAGRMEYEQRTSGKNSWGERGALVSFWALYSPQARMLECLPHIAPHRTVPYRTAPHCTHSVIRASMLRG